MKSFTFRLERLLFLRKHKEREWELKLAEATGKCIVERKEIEHRLSLKAVAFRDYFSGTLSAAELAASNLYLARLDQEIERHERMLSGFELEREKMQAELELRRQELAAEAQLRVIKAQTDAEISTNLPR